VNIASAGRTLELAADLGIVVPVPGQKRSRGDGILYVAPPWLRMAGLIAVRRGRPAAVLGAGGLAAGDGLVAAMAEVDALLARFDEQLNREPSGPRRMYDDRNGPADRPDCGGH
jgi:hypothetical protein